MGTGSREQDVHYHLDHLPPDACSGGTKHLTLVRYGNARANLIALSGSDTVADDDDLAHAIETFLTAETWHGYFGYPAHMPVYREAVS